MSDWICRTVGVASFVTAWLAGAGAGVSAPPAPAELKIAVYESQANAAVYKGVHQAPLRDWLKAGGYPFDVIGDRQAADPATLSRYAVVMATSCYIVPDTACSGLVKYVSQGGRLIWIDGPARCRHAELLATLGIKGGFSYVAADKARFDLTEPGRFTTAGTSNFVDQTAGNPALEAAGSVLAKWTPLSGKAAKGAALPALVLTRTGKGRAILFNWIPWLGHGPQAKVWLAGAVEYALAHGRLQDRPCAVRILGGQVEVAQPAPVSLRMRVIARPELAGRSASLTLRLLDAQGEPQGPERSASAALNRDGDELAWADQAAALATKGLADGEYTVVAEGKVGDVAMDRHAMGVTLNGQEMARLAAQEAVRARTLRPLLAGTLGDYDAEPRTTGGRVDIPRLLEQIQAAHMNTYDFLIWHARTDWDDLQLFVPRAGKLGVKVWITLVPPSEPPPSEPFGLDYVRWAQEIGKLSRRHDNIVAMVIDDFWSGENRSLFTPSYIAKVVSALGNRNPNLAFLPTIYWGTIGDAAFIRDYGRMMDGIVLPYADLESTRDLPAQLEACRKWLGPSKLLMVNVYASGSSGTGEKGPRTPEYMRSMLTISRKMSDGIRIYCLPKGDFKDYRFAITAELYGKWGRKP